MEIKKFKGLKNTTSPERLAPGELAVAQNLDLDDTKKLQTRAGYVKAASGAYHSLFGDDDVSLVMSGSDLYRLNQDYTTSFLQRLTASARVSYSRQQGTVYLSNGVDALRVFEGRALPWGIRNPVSQPVATTMGAGGLTPGTYMYAMTYRRAIGLEGGTGTAGVVEVTAAGSAIRFSSLESSTDPEVSDKIIYLSGANGTELFQAAVLPNSASVYDYRGDGSDLTARLDTQYVSPAPAGSIVEVYNGCAYVVSGNAVYHSDPYALESFRIRENFLMFPGQVTLFASVNGGIYVATWDRTWFLQGGHPKGDMKSQVVFDYGAIPGTAVKTVRGVLKSLAEEEEGAPSSTAVMWSSPHGVCFGTEDGHAINMTERDYAFPSAQRGATMIRQARGYTQFLTSLEGSGVAGNAYP